MSKVRPPYPLEFRQQMIETVRAGRSPSQLSREFGVTAQSIPHWVGRAAIDPMRRHNGLSDLSPLNFERSKEVLFDVVEET